MARDRAQACEETEASPPMRSTHLRPFLWAYPNFDPAAELRSAQSAAGTLDDCATWRGAREEPQSSRVRGAVPVAAQSPGLAFTHSPPVVPAEVVGMNSTGSNLSIPERRHERELQEKTRQLQQQQHWLLQNPPGPGSPLQESTGPHDSNQFSGSACSSRLWKRVCLGQAGEQSAQDPRTRTRPNDANMVGGLDEAVWRRARRTGDGQKLVETGRHVPPASVASADPPGTFVKPSLATQLSWSLSVASTPGSSTLPEFSGEARDVRRRLRRSTFRGKRKDLAPSAEDSPAMEPGAKRRVPGMSSVDEPSENPLPSHPEAKLLHGSNVGCLGLSRQESSRDVLPEGSSAKRSRMGGEGGKHAQWPTDSGTDERKTEDVARSVERESGFEMAPEGAKGDTKQSLPRLESVGPSSLSNGVSSGVKLSSSFHGVTTRKGSLLGAAVAEASGSGSGVGTLSLASGGKSSGSFPCLSQAMSSSSSHYTSTSVAGGCTGGAPVLCASLGRSAGTGCPSSELGTPGVAVFAPLFDSKMAAAQEEESFYMMPRFEMKAAKAKETLACDTTGPGSGSDDETAPKFILSSGRATATGRQKTKKVTIDDEFESYFAKLLL